MTASKLPGSNPTDGGGVKVCINGSVAPQKTIPVPIPAQREIAHQIQVLYLGKASFPPNFILPKGCINSNTIQPTKINTPMETIQPAFSINAIKKSVIIVVNCSGTMKPIISIIPINTIGIATGTIRILFNINSLLLIFQLF
jgi:hypothetical protein